ncbi:hypothetical protein ACLB2K_003816 [Fragaria x ananassa]
MAGIWLAMELKENGNPGCSGNNGQRMTVWERLWKLNVASKIKIFLWRAFHNFLPCTSNLKKNHLNLDEAYFRCGDFKEDTIHCLWRCRFAKKKIEVESDAVNVVQALNSFESDLSMEGPIFDEIRLLKNEFEAAQWKKIPRSSNKVAHQLAKEAVKFGGIKFWKEIGPPTCIKF